MNQPAEKQTTKQAWKVRTPICLAAMPLLYVLSLGPGLLLCRHNMIDNGIYRTFYHPLFWLMENSAVVNAGVEWYLGFYG